MGKMRGPGVTGEVRHLAFKDIGELALAKRLPLICLFPALPKFGCLMAYGPNMEDEFRRCAGYVSRIPHRAKPSELPIQRPEKFDLAINLKAAEAVRRHRTDYAARHS